MQVGLERQNPVAERRAEGVRVVRQEAADVADEGFVSDEYQFDVDAALYAVRSELLSEVEAVDIRENI